MRRRPTLALVGLLLLCATPATPYAVFPAPSSGRALLQKDADADADAFAPPAAKRAARPPPDDDPADFPPRVMEMLAGYLDNKARVRGCGACV